VEDAPAKPLFSIDFEDNGGVLVPRTIDELLAWINTEVSFWPWLQGTPSNEARSPIDQALVLLRQAADATAEARNLASSPNDSRNQIGAARGLLETAYRDKRLPHSTSTLGRRVHEIRVGSPRMAIAYLYTRLAATTTRFDANDKESFAGLVEGLFEQYLSSGAAGSMLRASEASLEQLKAKAEKLLAEKTNACEELHRNYAESAKTIASQATNQSEDYDKRSAKCDNEFNAKLTDHEATIRRIETTFKEGMRLRSPIGYWQSRQRLHMWLAVSFGLCSFITIGALGYSVSTMAHQLFGHLKAGENPSSWQLSSLIITAVFGAWAVRLIVRLFLSNSHLATDAAERIVMTQTYLALLEEDKISDEKDRSLVLSSLFRPGADGMIKDENIPHPTLDLLTRLGK
jgi:hypothetical protein